MSRERAVPEVTVRAVLLVAVALLVVVPMARLVQVLLEDGGAAADALGSARLARATRNSLVVGFGAVLVAVPLGTAFALATRRPDVPGRRALQVALLLPLLVPQFVLGYSWGQAYGASGLSDDVAGLTLPGLYGPAGVVLVTGVTAVPLAYLVVSAGLSVRHDADLDRAARASGASPGTVLRTVTLPLLRAPLVAAAALVLAAGLDAFAVPVVLGAPAGFTTITTAIYQDLVLASRPGAFTEAVTLAVLLAVLVLAVVGPADRAVGSRRLVAAGTGDAAADRRVTPAGRRLAALAWTYVVLAVGLPLAALVLRSLAPAPGVAPTPAAWTLHNFATALEAPALPAFGRSVLLAVAAATVLAVLGPAVALVDRRRRRRGSGSTGTLLVLTFALPGSVLAVGVALAYDRWLAGTLLIILLAYLAKLWAFAHRPAAGALDRLSPDELRAARAGGADPATVLRTVVLPRLAPALAAGWLLVFLVALHELTMSSLLYGPGTETVAVVVLNLQQLGDVGATAAASVLLTLAVLAAAAVGGGLMWRVTRATGSGRPGRPA